MDVAAFEAQLKQDGYSEIETKTYPPKPENNRHAHDCAVRGLVIEGAFIVRFADRRITNGPGDVFNVAAGIEHTEEIGPAGARLLVGRKY